MNQQENKLAKITEKLGLYVVGILTLLISFFLFAVSMLHTTAVEVVSDDGTTAHIVPENSGILYPGVPVLLF